MKSRCESCNSCGMPFQDATDYALGDVNAVYCKYCVDSQGHLLPYEKILAANAGYFKESQGLTEQAAIKMAKDLLISMPAWKGTL